MSGELITIDKLQEQLELFYSQKVYPYLNGAAHDGMRTVGEIIPMHSETCPPHCLPCDGSTYNKADYPQLAALLLSLTTHSQYEVDGDNTKFKVPDYRGEFIRGTGTNSHSGQGSGSNVGVHQDGTNNPYLILEAYTTPKLSFTGLISSSNPVNAPDNIDSLTKGTTDRIDITGTKTTVPEDYANRVYTSRPTNTSVLFCIVYENHFIDAKHNYSTQEHVVGTWIDGKPLYEKSISFTISTTGGTSINHNISNVEHIHCNFEGSYMKISTETFPLTCVYTGNTLDNIVKYSLNLNWVSATQFNICAGANRLGSGYITLQYTKTTDVASL